MGKLLRTVLVAIVGATLLVTSVPVFAEESNKNNCVETVIIGGENHEVCDTDGQSIFALLHLVIEIMTIGVGILGVIGISVTGIQYLTAGGSEEKTRKAKRRMFEIIIGLAIYATFFVIMQWVTPNFEIPEGSFEDSGGGSESSFEITSRII